jgi:peptide deformylase
MSESTTLTGIASAPPVGEPAEGAPDGFSDIIDPSTGRPLRPLTTFGQRVLHAKAAPVTVFDDALAKLVDDMFASMYAAPGVGLAAPQVGVGLRLFTYDCGPGARGHVCNPVLENVPGELQDDDEGCLSVPSLYFPTVRAMETRVTGVDVDGNPVAVEGRELLARCLQHETDHLDGMLYLDRLGGRIKRQAMREVREAEWHDWHWKKLTPRERPADDAVVPATLAERRAAQESAQQSVTSPD